MIEEKDAGSLLHRKVRVPNDSTRITARNLIRRTQTFDRISVDARRSSRSTATPDEGRLVKKHHSVNRIALNRLETRITNHLPQLLLRRSIRTLGEHYAAYVVAAES
jgi:hypothetical protein